MRRSKVGEIRIFKGYLQPAFVPHDRGLDSAKEKRYRANRIALQQGFLPSHERVREPID